MVLLPSLILLYSYTLNLLTTSIISSYVGRFLYDNTFLQFYY